MSKFKFIQIKRRDFDSLVHWVVCVDSDEHLHAYLEIVARRNVSEYYLAKKELELRPSNPHFGSNGGVDGGRLQYAIVAALESRPERKSIFDDVLVLDEVFTSPYVNAFNKFGKIYCNPSGGFYPSSAVQHDIIQTIETDKFVFPADNDSDKSDTRIFQWPNGKHYYAKVGMEDVVDQHGEQHWDSWTEAEAALNWYLNKKLSNAHQGAG